MSYEVALRDTGMVCSVERHTEGCLVQVGGSTKARLSVTYNYSKFYYEHLDKEQGLRWLDGKEAEHCRLRLALAVALLGIERDEDYWKATPGNAGYALAILYEWAKQHPDAVFSVS